MGSAAIHFSTIFMAFFAIMNPIANAPGAQQAHAVGPNHSLNSRIGR